MAHRKTSPRPLAAVLLLSSLAASCRGPDAIEHPNPRPGGSQAEEGHAADAVGQPPRLSPLQVFDRVCDLVESEFFDPDLRGVDWEGMRREKRSLAAGCEDVRELAPLLDPMLAALGTSHTRFLTADQIAYHDLTAIFGLGGVSPQRFPDGTVTYVGVGVLGRPTAGGYLVEGVLHGGPAAQSGLLTGDVVVSVDGAPFDELGSFAGRADTDVTLQIRRAARDPLRDVTLRPAVIAPLELLLSASEASMEVVPVAGQAVAYARLWSYADPRVHEALVDALTAGPLSEADALVLDLRGGWGGADPSYLDLFHDRVPRLEFLARDGEVSTIDSRWRRPVVLLVDRTTRSGKELLAHAFRRHAIGPVVGERTAGAATGGRAYAVGPDALLYLAVLDVRVDGERLEGVGVEPDVAVPFELRFSAGADPRRERALALAAELAASPRPSR
jgi:carboxyl-terminal processing protease